MTNVVVAVPDEECRVLAEQVVEEARRHASVDDRATKVARREYEVGELVAKTDREDGQCLRSRPSRSAGAR